MARIEHYFATEAECQAFREGLEYVNDSSIRNIQVRQVYTSNVAKPWRVEFEDADVESWRGCWCGTCDTERTAASIDKGRCLYCGDPIGAENKDD